MTRTMDSTGRSGSSSGAPSSGTPPVETAAPSAAVRRNSWAKAPDFAGDPEHAAAGGPRPPGAPPPPAGAGPRATAGDREHYLRGGMTEIECRSCHACVLVKKTSSYHTSVQWNSEARAKCGELERLRQTGGNPALMPTCSRMSASIDHGVAEGIIPAESPEVDPDGYW